MNDRGQFLGASAPEDPTDPPRPGARARPALARVLLVDDEPDVRRVGEITLRAFGHLDVLLAGSGPEAIEIAARLKPDAILLDVMMPGMDGPTTLARLRERADTAEIPVVFLTAKAQMRDRQRYLGLGAIGVIDKPFDPLSLASELRGLVGAG